MEQSEISQWYAGQHIFVTGATGFMGKILVEKILRSCPNVATIYLLVRPKKGKEARHRLEDFLNSPVFDRIKNKPNHEEIFQKLHCIRGDISQPNCGMLDKDGSLLSKTVTVVFHMAANVRFDQPLKNAVKLNTGGAQNVLDLVCKFKNLKAFVHVSTSYSHCDVPDLKEELYKAPHEPRKILDMVEWLDDDVLTSLTPKLLKNYPNTYAYTKCLTEQLVSEYSDRLPIAITRPSIIIASYKEPFPGWVDNLNGTTGVLVGVGKGVLSTMHCIPEYAADLVPVDISINFLLIAAWKTGSQARKDVAEVYHITANKDYLMSWGDVVDLGKKYILKYPFSVCLWYPSGVPNTSYLVHSITAFFCQFVPAYIIDFFMLLTGNKPFLVQTQKKIRSGLKVLQYYTTTRWNFDNRKLYDIYDKLSSVDKKIFFTNREKLNVEEYITNYILGARKYCAGEDLDTLPKARKLLQRLYYIKLARNLLICGLLLWIFFGCMNCILDIFGDPFHLVNNTFFEPHPTPM